MLNSAPRPSSPRLVSSRAHPRNPGSFFAARPYTAGEGPSEVPQASASDSSSACARFKILLCTSCRCVILARSDHDIGANINQHPSRGILRARSLRMRTK
jgi:hypothetical protein